MDSISEPRLDELQKQASGLEQRSLEQQATVQKLRRALAEAKESDLNAEASALASGSGKPKAKAPAIERSLEVAEHDLAVFQRAAAMAQGEVGQFYAKHHPDLMRKLAASKAQRAQEVAELARPLLVALRGYFGVDDDAKLLARYQPPPEESPAPGTDSGQRNTLVVSGSMTTSNIFGDRIAGLERGQLEGVLSALANLPAAYAKGQAKASEASEGAA